MNPNPLMDYTIVLYSALLCFAMFCAAAGIIYYQHRKMVDLRNRHKIAVPLIFHTLGREEKVKYKLFQKERELLIQFELGAELAKIKGEWKERALRAERTLTRIERGDESFLKKCDEQMVKISKLPTGKTVNEDLYGAVKRNIDDRYDFWKQLNADRELLKLWEKNMNNPMANGQLVTQYIRPAMTTLNELIARGAVVVTSNSSKDDSKEETEDPNPIV